MPPYTEIDVVLSAADREEVLDAVRESFPDAHRRQSFLAWTGDGDSKLAVLSKRGFHTACPACNKVVSHPATQGQLAVAVNAHISAKHPEELGRVQSLVLDEPRRRTAGSNFERVREGRIEKQVRQLSRSPSPPLPPPPPPSPIRSISPADREVTLDPVPKNDRVANITRRIQEQLRPHVDAIVLLRDAWYFRTDEIKMSRTKATKQFNAILEKMTNEMSAE